VGLSTSSVYPESTASCFELAGRLGYDGVEVMVGIDPVSRDVDALVQLREYHDVPVLSVHAPTLLVTQGTWGNDPWEKLERSAVAAHRSGPTASWCIRRSAGSAPTRKASSTASGGWSAPPASSSPWRTCSPGGGRAAPRCAPTRRLGPD
jgi:sugar phosphate isomerase/epimerase